MNKKLISFLGAALIITSLSTGVLAAGDVQAASKPDRLEALQQKQQELQNKIDQLKKKRLEKAEEQKKFKEAVEALKAKVKETSVQNKAKSDENKALGLEIKNTLKGLKDNNVTLPEEKKAILKGDKEQLKVLFGNLEQTKGKVKELLEQSKESIKGKDLEKLASLTEQANSIQKSRLGILNQINEKLKHILGVIKG
jgi:chromosome segregation ATPase